MANKVDYSGRTVDLLLLKTVLAAPTNRQIVDIDVSANPMIVTGIEKLVQRFAVIFLNELGSTHFHPDYGTDIVGTAKMGQIYDVSSLQAAASSANLRAYTQIVEGDAALETPDDEQLVNSEVVQVAFVAAQSKAEISIRLTTAAGSSYDYIVPVAIGVHS